MKIGLDIDAKKIQEYTYIPTPTTYSKTEKADGVRLDITGMYMDDNAYGVHGRTTEDVMKQAAAIDVATARDYMTVMSNSMSGDDFKKMQEDGFDPSKMDGSQSVTILDHIKAVMAEAGEVIVGYNDDLSKEVLAEVGGSETIANTISNKLQQVDLPVCETNIKEIEEAVALTEQVNELSDGNIKYMVDNDMQPTVENIYTARFSSTGDGSKQARGYYAQDMGGYLAKKAEKVEWDELKEQVKKNLDAMDLGEVDAKDAMQAAKWLIEKGIPVTEDKIRNYLSIKQIDWPVDNIKVVDSATKALFEGKKAKEANLSPKYEGVFEKAFAQKEKLLKMAISREETRLAMSLDANIRLIKNGKNIDTESVTKILDELKEQEYNLRREFLGNGTVEELDAKVSIYEDTRTVLDEIPSLPLATIGRISAADSITLRSIHSVGISVKAEYIKANDSYEQMMTSPRKDMGDSIKKAFRNVDDILADLKMELSDENRRAVRILGYNSIEINEENITKIRLLDRTVQSAVRSLTPGKTLSLIRKGINPLDMSIDEVVEETSKLDSNPQSDAEKYSRFLYKLEQNREITPKERESYIGIYRMLNMLEKNDYAAIGAIAESGINLTFGNLIQSVRSSKIKMDVNIDDNFGFLDRKIVSGTSITDQIMAAYEDSIGSETNAQLEDAYINESMQRMREQTNVSDNVIEEVLNAKTAVSFDNVEAAQAFATDINSIFVQMDRCAKKDISENYRKKAETLLQSMDNKDSMSEAYDEFSEAMTDILTQAQEEEVSHYIDLKSIILMHKQISFATQAAKEEDYYIPVNVQGKQMGINLKMIHGQDDSNVSVHMNNEIFGDVTAVLKDKGSYVSAIIYYDGETPENINRLAKDLDVQLTKLGYEQNEIETVTTKSTVSNKFSAHKADKIYEDVSDKQLYMIGKVFVEAMTAMTAM